MRLLMLACSLLMISGIAAAAVKTEVVEYTHGDVTLEGYLALDDSITTRRPGILIVHQWTGVSDHEREVAEKLAGLGYVAFVADIYGKGVRPAAGAESGKVAGIYKKDRALLRGRVQRGLEQLRSHPMVDASRTAALGYCFGGMAVLELARSGSDVDGVVSFHGNLDTPAPGDAKNITARVLVLHGAEDPYVKDEGMLDFMNEMRDGNVDWQLVAYGGAVHSFTDKDADSDGARYNEKADRRSWAAMREFFRELLDAEPAAE